MAEQQQQQEQQKQKKQKPQSPQQAAAAEAADNADDASDANADVDSSSGSAIIRDQSTALPVFAFDESVAADFADNTADNAGAAAGAAHARFCKPGSASTLAPLARLSQARKLRKTRLSISNFISPPARSSERLSIAGSDAAEIWSNSNESASSYGSVPSDFDDLCNNN